MRTNKMIIAAASVIMALLPGVAAPAQAASPKTAPARGGLTSSITRGEGPFEWNNFYTGFCLAVAKGSTTDGAPVIEWPCNGGDEQKWYYSNGWDGDGYGTYLINKKSGKCLSVPSGSTAKGKQLIIWPCYGYDDQFWIVDLRSPDEGGVTMKNDHSGQYMAISSENWYSGSPVFQWPWTDGFEQWWLQN
jgi:hypothetical protein